MICGFNTCSDTSCTSEDIVRGAYWLTLLSWCLTHKLQFCEAEQKNIPNVYLPVSFTSVRLNVYLPVSVVHIFSKLEIKISCRGLEVFSVFLGFNTCKHCGVSTVVAYTSSLLLLLVEFINFYKNYVSVTVAFCGLDLVANLQYSDLRLFAWKGLDFGVYCWTINYPFYYYNEGVHVPISETNVRGDGKPEI